MGYRLGMEINNLFSVHCICIKSGNLLRCHISIVRNRAHVTHIKACTDSNSSQFYCLFFILNCWILHILHHSRATWSIIWSQFAVVALISYMLLLLLIVLIFRWWNTSSWAKALPICRIVHHWCCFVVNCSTFSLEEIVVASLVFVHQLNTW